MILNDIMDIFQYWSMESISINTFKTNTFKIDISLKKQYDWYFWRWHFISSPLKWDEENLIWKSYLLNTIEHHYYTVKHNVDRLVQERRNSIANALELRFSCTKPSTW